MKKAKEYATEFNTNPTNETLGKIAMAFLFEVKEIGEVRHVQKDNAVISIFKEQDQKWRAFAKLSKGIRPDGFQILVKEKLPFIYERWIEQDRKRY